MPDFAPDFTPRYRVQYVSAGLTHWIMLRGFRDESESATGVRVRDALFDTIAPMAAFLCDDFEWISAEYIPQDTNIGVPDSLPAAITGTVAISTMSREDKIRSIGYVGRSGSTPMRLFVFGCQFQTDDLPEGVEAKFRISAADLSNVATSIAALDGAGCPANNNFPGHYHNYVNLKVNDHLLKFVRRGLI